MSDILDDPSWASDGVYFLPWIGDQYAQGFQGRRFLILGESHYDTWDDGDGLGARKHELSQTFTRECIREVIGRTSGAQFFRYVEQILVDENRQGGWAPSGGSRLWHCVAFYNFVQSAIEGTAKTPPSREQFRGSFGPFLAVMERLRPERVLVCGKRLWNAMGPTSDQLTQDLQAYRLSCGMKVWCRAIKHPSKFCRWRQLHGEVLNFLRDTHRDKA